MLLWGKNVKGVKIVSVIFIILFFSSIVYSVNVMACKDIVACGDATAGDYNLLLKVRDPSRPDLQVLCIVPEGYEYKYHHPWTGKPMSFKTRHKYIGVASIDDIIPNIVKAGMVLTDAGIAFGDADTGSNWKNPTKNAWDDFDWIRYACQEADDEDEAVTLLTEDIVDQMHAPGISENLFVAGPNKGFVVEADAFHFDIKEINDGIVVMSNYPKELWKTQVGKKLPIATSFNFKNEKYVEKGDIISLDSLFRIKILDVGENWILVRHIPFFRMIKMGIMIIGIPVKIELGERETVGDFSVELLDIDGNNAKVSLCNKYKAWEDRMMQYIQPHYGSITISDMMCWSRLHEDDLDGLRPMCEDRSEFEAAAIFKIPEDNYEILSSIWFAANHPCSSIYIPVHICDNELFDPFENGNAASLSLELVKIYGHDTLNSSFSKVENVLLYETDVREQLAVEMIENNTNVSNFLTFVDVNMQKQAWLTEKIWLDTSNITDENLKQQIIEIIDGMWDVNYSISLGLMNDAIVDLGNVSEAD